LLWQHLIAKDQYSPHQTRPLPKKKGSPGLFNGAPTEYLLVQLLSAEGDELPVDRETKFFNGLVPLAEDLLVLVKLENAEKCDPLLDLLLL